MGKTLYEKIWKGHIVKAVQNQPDLLYVDLHLTNEVTSPQAFAGLREKGRKVRRPDLTLATLDHATPTDLSKPFSDPLAKKQVETMRENCKMYHIPLFDLRSTKRGIVHIIAPELGLTQPGQIIVCGDSHTSTHGAFGALAFGIGTSEVEHVLVTQSLKQYPSKTMAIEFEGEKPTGVTAKDLILALISQFGTDFATGYTVEYRGPVIESLSMEERMTICNMSIEMGARAGLIAPDQTTFDYLQKKPHAPKGKDWEEALSKWKQLRSDEDAKFDKVVAFNVRKVAPQVTWGTNPGMGTSIESVVPDPSSLSKEARESAEKALAYMDLKPLTPITAIGLDVVFIGSCTNSRIEDLREAARVVKGYRIANHVRALVVPGSQSVKAQAEAEGLHQVFIDAGFQWRESGCSMCLGMNDDVVHAGERCASTSNRNFEGRQGRGARTHLVSPAMAAAAAIKGHFVDVRKWEFHKEEVFT